MSDLPEVERRIVSARELRLSGPNAAPRIEGYPSLFNVRSENLGGFREIVSPNAFQKALAQSDIRALFNHSPNYVLGRVKSGTLKVVEDDTGLWMENSPPNTTWVRDLIESMRRGDIDQMSFGFRVAKNGQKWSAGEDGVMLRTVTEVEEVRDVSIVTYPAYPDTKVAVRSLNEWLETAQPEDWRVALDALRRRHKQALEL